MPDRNGESSNTDEDTSADYLRNIQRRRLLQLTGAGIVGGSLVTGVAGAASDLPHTIVFDGSDTDETADYEFGVTGSVEAHPDVGSFDSSDSIDGTLVTGRVYGAVDAYRFSGNLTALDVDGQVAVSIDYGARSTPDADTLEILTPADGSVEYTFVCDGPVEKDLDNGMRSAERGNDDVTDDGDGTYTVTGLVGNGYGDTFDLYGDLTRFVPVTGEFTLLLNGQETTVTELTGQSVPDDDEPSEPDSHRLELVAAENVEYRFRTSGELSKVLDNGDNSAETANDTVTDNGDGTWTAEGLTGNGYGDTYAFTGDVLDFEILAGDCVVYLDGEEVSPAELNGDDGGEDDGSGDEDETLDEAVFYVGFHHDAWLTYSLHLDARPEPLSDDETFVASNYDVDQLSDGTWLVEGQTGTADPSGPMYGDSYRWTPEEGDGILGWSATAPDGREYYVSLNQEELDPASLPALQLPEEDDSPDVADGGPIGGGAGYGRTVTRDRADVVVRTRSELRSALSSASSGDVVFVAGDDSIHMGSNSVTVPAGVTVASDRGANGAAGALVYTDGEPTDLFRLRRNARLTGLRVRGPHPGGDRSGSSQARAVTVAGNGAEIDNNDIWGFSYAGVMVRGGEAHIHHNVLRECNKGGLGYGVSMMSGYNTIEYNYMNFNRHSVATDGSHRGYICRYNHFGPDTYSHVIDMHDPAGTRYEVHNNVVEGYVAPGGAQRPGVAVRGVPDDVAIVEDNWFWNPDRPLSSPSYTWTDEAIIQPETGSSWQNVSFSSNAYGKNAGVGFSDVIPGYDGWRS